MPKDNLLFKLDNLEYQYHYANGDLSSFRPRLGGIAKLYNAKGKKSSKRVTKLLSNINLEQVAQQLDALRLQIFNNKVYYLEKNLRSLLVKNLNQYRPKKNAKNDFTPLIAKIRDEYGIEHFAELVCKSKTIKVSIAKVVPSKKVSVPNWFANHEFWKVHNDKKNAFNPSRVWNEVLMPNKFDQLVSTTMNNEKCRTLFSSFDSGMNVFLGINRQMESKKEDNSVEKDQEVVTDASETTDTQGENEDPGDVVELGEDLLKQYDGLLGDSDEEEDDFEAATLNPDVNYNEMTDEEPDHEDDDADIEAEGGVFDSDNESDQNRGRARLPELMAGYYSGGDSDEDDDRVDDKVAREQISTKEKRKNRRGQRARRKIWEKKYGRQAKHIQREIEKEHQERKRRLEEYEERVAKRAAKAKKLETQTAEPTHVNQTKAIREREKTEHPSWIAKREAEQKLKNTKFQGRKITFD
ncbi:hypothetical protein HG536_0G01260 [Torulaspora globosa]|uniref:Bud22 domain-containing protein n=1 Tax=Torulaspora globosa TaxID=48254 RepID=A0A7G3ZL81_9SACH|nr:uncharacterized protein HG536_0G01260 [Torulaspora globosa]QLL34267.1 hypothetical protein HG536_0G01260 [Torulaspora globosa]